MQRTLDKTELQQLLIKIGFTPLQLQQYELQFLSNSERYVIKNLSTEIFVLEYEIKELQKELSLGVIESEKLHVIEQNAQSILKKQELTTMIQTIEKSLKEMNSNIYLVFLKIKEQLEKVNLKGLKNDKTSQYNAFHVFKEVEKQNSAFTNSDDQCQNDQNLSDGWQQLSDKDKKFYDKISEITKLMDTNKKVQNFYKDRIQNIKSDQEQQTILNEQNIKIAIKDYVKLNPNSLNETNYQNPYEDKGLLKNEETKEVLRDNSAFFHLEKVTDFTCTSNKRMNKQNQKMNRNAPSFYCTDKQKQNLTNLSGAVYLSSNEELDLLISSDEPYNCKKQKFSSFEIKKSLHDLIDDDEENQIRNHSGKSSQSSSLIEAQLSTNPMTDTMNGSPDSKNVRSYSGKDFQLFFL